MRGSHNYGPYWGTVRACTGVLWDNLLLYATGGLAFMSVDEVGIGNAAGQTAFNREVRSSWVVGGGLEYVLSPNMTAKIECLHMDFGSMNGLGEKQERYSFDSRVGVVRKGISFKF